MGPAATLVALGWRGVEIKGDVDGNVFVFFVFVFLCFFFILIKQQFTSLVVGKFMDMFAWKKVMEHELLGCGCLAQISRLK